MASLVGSEMIKRMASEHTTLWRRVLGKVGGRALNGRPARMEILVQSSLLQLFDNINQQERLGDYYRGQRFSLDLVCRMFLALQTLLASPQSQLVLQAVVVWPS